MKKLYTLALASAVALTSAAGTQMAQKVASFGDLNANAGTAKAVQFTKNTNGKRAASSAPKSLEGTEFLLGFTLEYQEAAPESSYVEFNFIGTDATTGYDEYTMSGLMEEVFTNVDPIAQTVYYDSTTGELVMPAGQNFCEVDGIMCTTWNMYQDGYVSGDIEFNFKWNGTGFDWVREGVLEYEDGSSKDYTSQGLFVGYEREDGRIGGLFSLTDFEFVTYNGTMSFTMTNTESNQAQPGTSPIAVSVKGNKVTIYEFAGSFTVPFTLDTEAKTLSAIDVQLGQVNIGGQNNPVYAPAMLSEAVNDGKYAYNAYDAGTYKLVMNYTVANGKTTINVPEWNIFYLDGNEDYDFLGVLITKNSISLDFELGAATEGVESITIDNSNAPVEYYNLQGVRVANPESGLYIRRQGNTATKVLVK